jgi:drug/metabolite transporter (DMT)-like permease
MQRSFLLSSLLIAGLGSILFSAKAIVVKLCYQYGVDSATVLSLRMLFSLPFFWVAVWWSSRQHQPSPMAKQDILSIIFLGFVGYYLSSYLDFLGLQYITVGLERIILYLNPTIVLLISMLFLKKKIHKQQWLALLLAYAGVTIVFSHDLHTMGPSIAWGGMLVFLSAISYAVYLIFAGEIVGRVGSIRLVAYASASSTFFSTVQALILNPTHLWTQVPEVYQLSLFNALFCTFMPMLMVMIAVNRIGSSLTAQAGMLGPIATIFLGWFFLGEKITFIQVIGMLVVLCGVAILATMQTEKNQPRPELAEAE